MKGFARGWFLGFLLIAACVPVQAVDPRPEVESIALGASDTSEPGKVRLLRWASAESCAEREEVAERACRTTCGSDGVSEFASGHCGSVSHCVCNSGGR